MTGSKPPWSVPVAGVLVLLAASLTGIISASDPGARPIELPCAGVAGLIGLGLLARWRWAVWAGFALVPVSAALTVVAFKTDTGADGTSAGPMMAAATTFLLLLLLPALPGLLRHPRRHAAADGTSGKPEQPAPPSQPPTLRQRVVFGMLAVPTVILGMCLFLIVLLGLTSGPADPVAIFVLAVLLLLFGSIMVMFRPRRRDLTFDLTQLSVEGARSHAFLARYDRLERAAVLAVLPCMAVIGTCTLIEANWPPVIWLSAAILTALAAIGLLVLLTTGWRRYVALVPTGLYVPGPRRPTFVPWAAIEGSSLNRINNYNGWTLFVAVSLSDPAAIKTSLVGRLLRLINRRYGADLLFPARMLATEPEFLVHAIDVYRSNPARQRAIGTVGELDLLHAEWTGQPSQTRPANRHMA